MKIIIVDTTLSGNLIGGAQTFLPHLARGLVDKGHEVHIVSNGIPSPKINKQLEESGALVHTAIWDKRMIPDDAAKKLAVWVNGLQPDIYLISVSPDTGWLALPYLNPGIATLSIGHTDSDTFYRPARHYHSFLTAVVGVSEEVAKQYNEKSGFSKEQISWIPYGVSVAAAFPAASEKEELQLIYVGRLEEEQKRVSDLTAIALKLHHAGIPFHLSIVGDGPEMPNMQLVLKELVEKNKVEFTGWLDNRTILELLRRSDVFVLTSAYEGFCIALVEAMANGCCPVVTNIASGNKQLITHGQNGFLLPVGGLKEFEETLNSLQQNKKELISLRTTAWKEGKKYGILQMAAAYEQCFLDAREKNKIIQRKPISGFPVMESCKSGYPLWIRRIKAKYLNK